MWSAAVGRKLSDFGSRSPETEVTPELSVSTRTERPAWHVTGNHYLSIPFIDSADGAIHGVNVLHRGQNGLLEWSGARLAGAGDPLLRPRFRVAGEALAARDLQWELLDHWIPRFRCSLAPALRASGTVCAPGGPDVTLAGAVYVIELENAGSDALDVVVELEGVWAWSLKTVRTSRPLPGANRLWLPPGGRAVVLEQAGGAGASLCILSGEGGTAGLREDGVAGPDAAGEVVAPNGEPLRFMLARAVRVPARGKASVAFYLGVAPERDGAVASAHYLAAQGAAGLLRDARLALTRLTRRVRDAALGRILNRNLLFNYFFALGRGVDDDRYYPVASRSPAYDGGAATFSDREALLWTLPALTLADYPTARDVLLQIFDRYSLQAGIARRYIDGAVLEPGYALDGACAYGIALDRFVEDARDESVLDEAIVQQVLHEIQNLILGDLHPEIFLCATEVAPSGDFPDHRYLAYDNALVAAFCRTLDRVWRGREPGEQAQLAGAGEEAAAALWRHGTAGVEGLTVLAFSTDLAGESAVYDDPNGSLQLLPHYGFCDPEDPIWRDTVELLRSESYPLWIGDARYPGLASRTSARRASLAALCADLLGARRDAALATLRELPLENGLACEWYDPDTGRSAGGEHYAALAGFVAWALREVVE